MYELIVGDDATGDLEQLIETNRSAALRIIALLEDLQDNQDLMDRLTQDGYGGTPWTPIRGAVVSIKKWVSAQKLGMNLWRMRDFELSKRGQEYRVIYAFNPSTSQYYVLAVVERAFNYDEQHPVTQRIFSACRQLEDQW